MPLLVALEGCAPSPVTIVRDFEDGRVLVRFEHGAEWTVPSTCVQADDGAPPLMHRSTPGRMTENQVRVLHSLAMAGPFGMTDDEHEAVNGLRADSAGKRRVELQRLGYVTDTGDRRPTRRDGTAKIWQITSAGEAALRSHRMGESA